VIEGASLRRGLVLFAALGGAVTGAGLIFAFDPAHYGFYPICYLHALTGLNCPGCGSTRAVHELLHGHLLAAARLNLLLVLSLPHAAWLTARLGIRWLSGQPVGFVLRPMWLWAFLTLATVFTVLRNLPGFEWLAP
jgi:hypothetical protein